MDNNLFQTALDGIIGNLDYIVHQTDDLNDARDILTRLINELVHVLVEEA